MRSEYTVIVFTVYHSILTCSAVFVLFYCELLTGNSAVFKTQHYHESHNGQICVRAHDSLLKSNRNVGTLANHLALKPRSSGAAWCTQAGSILGEISRDKVFISIKQLDRLHCVI